MNFDMNSTNMGDTGSKSGLSGNNINLSLVKSEQEMAVANTTNSLMSKREAVKNEIMHSGEAQRISDTLSVHNPQSIIEFGKQVSEQISSCADEILKRQSVNTLNSTSNMMVALSKIMDKVDIGELSEISDKKPGFMERIFNNAQKKIESLTSKYNNIGTEIEKVCVELRAHEQAIQQSNKDLDILYENGVKSYQELMKYTIAGEMALEEIEQYKIGLNDRANSDPDVALELNNVVQAEQLLEQRVQDLRLAETVALQSLPIIKSMQFGNLNLARKINSAFIITIPVFKNACAQAIIAKKQAMQAQAMQALDAKTNEMLIRNAQNAANNMRLTTQLAGSSAIKIETVQNSWQIIMDGIKDTKAIQEELARQRQQDRVTIERMNQQFLSQTGA